jgi:hypothetical protein
MTIRDTLTEIRVKQTTNADSLQQNFIHPLRVCGKVVILQCRWPVNRAGRKIDPTSILAEIATKNKAPIF